MIMKSAVEKKKPKDKMFGKKKMKKKTGIYKKEGSVLEKKPKDPNFKKKKIDKKTGLVKKEGSVYKKKMDSSAAANQLKDLGNEKYKGVEKKGYAKKGGSHIKKTEARVARDYAANAAYDAEHGYKKEAKFEKKKLMHVVNRIAGAKNR